MMSAAKRITHAGEVKPAIALYQRLSLTGGRRSGESLRIVDVLMCAKRLGRRRREQEFAKRVELKVGPSQAGPRSISAANTKRS